MAIEEDEYQDSDGDEDFEAGGSEDEEELEEEQEPEQRKKPGKKRKGAQFFEEEADEDDDDEEEEGGARKRPKASRFIDDIAAVDSDEEEEEADEDVDDMLAYNDEDLGGDDLVGAGAAHYRELDVMRQDGREGKTEEELAKFLEDKYGAADYDEEDDFEQYGEEEDVGQQGLQPTKEDPGLFIVACRLGSEREACLQLLQKAYNMAERGTPLGIKSAICLDHLKGYFYVEAFRDAAVLEAIKGLRTIYPSKGARLVPMRERAAAITVNRQAKAAIERDSWVRVRGGLYKDDLAKVVDVDFASGRATIKLVPRLDLQAMAKDHMGGGARRNPFGRQAVRPPPKPFRAKEAGELGLPVGKDRNDPAVITLNTHRFIDGYTLRNYTLKGLILQDVAPPLDEISRFNQAGQAGELEDAMDPTSGLQQLLKALPDGAAPKATFVKGDRVVVVSGDLNTLEGSVEDVRAEDGKIVVRPDMMPDQTVELELGEVQKLFKAGDHVRVLSGPHAGERGMVVKMQDGMCILLPDTHQGELKVFARDLTEAQESGTGVETLGGKYELHDLVQLDAHVAGVIIGIDKDVARVLTNQSTDKQPDIRLCKEPDIMRKLQTSRAATTDAAGSTINNGDYVTIVDAMAAARGHRKDKGGTVHAISRGVLFVRSPEFSGATGGFVVARNRQVRLRGSTAATAGNPAATPGSSNGVGFGNILASPMHSAGGGPQNPFGDRGGGGGGFGRGGGGGRGGRGHGGGMMGVEVTVKCGPYARYKGRVKQETATHLQLELDAINRIVTVKKEHVIGKGMGMPGQLQAGRGFGYQPQMQPGRGFGYSPSGPPKTPAHVMATPSHPSMAGATPLHPSSSRTPMHPSMTPSHPSMTPMHPSMTPMHPGMTPSHPSLDPGTDYYNRSSRGPSAATPGGDGYGGPAAGAVSTPGLGAYGAAPTPGTAETPGGVFADPGSARTPGVAATPGDQYGTTAYTPGSYAPAATPGGQDLIAPSPAGGVYPGDSYYAQPTPGMGATPGTVQTPGLITGYTPMQGVTPNVAYTPGLDGVGAGPGGVPGTPGFNAAGADGMMLPSLGTAGGLQQQQQQQQPQVPRQPDYRDVLVRLPGGGIGVGSHWRDDSMLEAVPLEGGDVVLLDVVELVPAEKKDIVKVVYGEKQGQIGQVMLFDRDDVVLVGGDIVDSTQLGKLAPAAADEARRRNLVKL